MRIRNLLFFFLMTASFTGSEACAEDAPRLPEARMVPVCSSPGSAFAWIKHGAVYRVIEGSSCWGVVYRGQDGRMLVLTQEPAPIGKVIAAELKSEDVRSFLDARLPHVLLELLGRSDDWLIDTWYMDQLKKLLAEGDLGYYDHARIAPTMAVLEKYRSPGAADIDGLRWKRIFYVVCGNGCVQRWEAFGQLTPFSIDGLNRTEKERGDSVLPLPTVGGTIRRDS